MATSQPLTTTTSCNEIGNDFWMILQLDVSLFSFQTMLPASAMVRVTEHCQSPTPSPSVQAAVPCVGRWVRCPSPIRPQPLRSKSYPSLSPSFQFTVLFQNSYSFPQNSPRFHPNLPPHPTHPLLMLMRLAFIWPENKSLDPNVQTRASCLDILFSLVITLNIYKWNLFWYVS